VSPQTLSPTYFERLRSTGFTSYCRTLLCLELPAAAELFGLLVPTIWVILERPGFLVQNWWLYPLFLLARAVFHWKIGLLADRERAFHGAIVGVATLAFIWWALAGFTPFFAKELQTLLGGVGLVLSFLIAWPLSCIAVCGVLFFPWFFMRGVPIRGQGSGVSA
jgi:hypothetical protein